MVMAYLKKFTSIALSICMLLSIHGFALADNNTQPNTQSDQANQEELNNLYSDFPVQIDKTIRKDMTMDMTFEYPKDLGEDDFVNITITNVLDNSVCMEYVFSANDKRMSFKNVPNNTVYCVSVSEQIDGSAEEYVGYIETKFVKTDFPVDLQLGDIEYNNNSGETHTNVLIKKVGDNPICTHNEDEECTSSCSISSVVSEIPENELDTFYSELDADSYYELQTEASSGGKTSLYQGFISTYEGGEYEGVFSRGYSLHDTLDSINGYPMTASALSLPDFSNAYEYEYYQNEYISTLTYSDEFVIKFVAPTTGYYTIETIGNADTMFQIYSETDGVINASPTTVRQGGEGENARTNIGLLVNDEYHPVKYIVLTLEDGNPAPSAFRIIRDEDITYGDDFTNFRDEVQSNCEDSIYSSPINNNCWIDYNGDVDVFGFDIDSGYGYIDFERITTNPSDNEQLEANIYSVVTEQTPFDSCWREDTIYTDDEETQMSFSSGRHYVEIRQATSDMPIFGTENDGYYDDEYFKYKFNFYDPRHKDPIDEAGHATYGNNAPTCATEITDFPYIRTDLTLHKGDSDWFVFETGSNGGNLCVTVEKAGNILTYIPHLYDKSEITIYNTNPPEWSIPEDMADYVSSADNSQNTLTYNGLLPNHEYYIKIDRANSTSYSSMHPYTLSIELTVPDVPTATLSNNVTLTHTIGDNITSTDTLIDELMNSLTCYINGVAVSDEIASADVKLYYNDSELTPAMINVMAAGTYPLVAKYQDVVVTGGTINLEVSAAQSEDNIIMLDNLPLESVTNASWDWAATARILANTRLLREGTQQTTYTVQQAIMAVKTGGYTTRGTIEEVVKAANYFYSGGSQDTYNFINDTISVSTAENTLANALQSGQTVIMQLTSISNPTDVGSMRYIILCGINLTTHEYIVFDPVLNQTITVSQDTIHTGGYNGNSDLKFTGQVIEFM